MTVPARRRKGSLLGTVKAVLWGFLGVRRKADFQDDVTKLNPIHVLVVGLVLGIVFVATLMLIVSWVVKS